MRERHRVNRERGMGFYVGLLATTVLTAGLLAAGRSAEPKPSRTTGPPASSATDEILWLETLDLELVLQDYGAAGPRSNYGRPITLAGRQYEHGVGTHAYSLFILDLKGVAERFEADAGVDDEVAPKGLVRFVVRVDGREVVRTPPLHGGEPPEHIVADLRGARRCELIVEDEGDIDCDHADWADARLILKAGAADRPIAVAPDWPVPRIARGVPPEPRINAPRITGATPGKPFVFRIPATGQEPLRYAAEGLPAGLTLDEGTGIITGSLSAAGETKVRLTVTGPSGRAESVLTIVGGENKLALTPPMGWNSWNVWGDLVDAEKVRAAGEWMVKSGLAGRGYCYVNIDDGWAGGRDYDGNIYPNGRFGTMKPLADYLHSMGLRLGVYSSPGSMTCAQYNGSWGHEEQDARTYAEWGVDLLKYDWCYYARIAKDQSVAEFKKPYKQMGDILKQQKRDIVLSVACNGWGEVATWGREVGGQLWRTTWDIRDNWPSMSGNGFSQSDLAKHAGPGGWNDPDMLVVGKVGWGPNVRPTRLTPSEQVTHMTLWSLLAAPLLIGCDMSQLDEFTLAVLGNPEVIEVDQDPLGRQATRVTQDGALEVWARPLADGTHAVGLFNRGRTTANVIVTWTLLGREGSQPVRALWQRKDLGSFADSYTAEAAPHGAVLVKVGQPR